MNALLTERIIELLKVRRLSIAQLERTAGLSIHSVRNILSGRIQKPSAETLQAIATALDCALPDLLNSSSEFSLTIQPSATLKRRHEALIEDFDLMLKSCEVVLNYIREKNYQFKMETCFAMIEMVYFFAEADKSKTIDHQYVRWLVDAQYEKVA